MASQQDVIKEFLVALGFKVDDAAYKRFADGISGATKGVNALGIATAVTESAAVAMIAKIADGMEKLYYASQRTGSAVAGIKAFGFAASQLGGSFDGALSSLENLGHFIRSYPGSGEFLKRLGVAPEHVKDSVAAMKDLEKTFQGMPFWLAQPYANVLGIDEKTLLALQSGEYSRYMDDYNQKLKESGVDATAASARSHEFMIALRELGAESEVLGIAIEQHVIGPMTDILNLITALEKALLRVPSLLGAAVTHPGGMASTVGSGLSSAGSALAPATHEKTGEYLGRIASSAGHGLATAGGMIARELGFNKPTDPWSQTVQYFKDQGWSQAQAQGIAANLFRESSFNPSTVGDGGQAYGLAQWHPDRQAAFKTFSGHDIHQSTKAEQLAFVQYELTQGGEQAVGRRLRAARTAYDAGVTVTDYERPRNLVSERALRGDLAEAGPAGAAVINQTNTYNINGAADPNAVAGAIANRQNDTNKQLIRNIGGAVK